MSGPSVVRYAWIGQDLCLEGTGTNLGLVEAGSNETSNHSKGAATQQTCRSSGMAVRHQEDEPAHETESKHPADDQRCHGVSIGTRMAVAPLLRNQHWQRRIDELIRLKETRTENLCVWGLIC